MTATSFFTLQNAATGLYKEKGSKFLSFAYPVQGEEEIKEHLNALRKEYFDARHHCYAWMLGVDKKSFRANDDGEPNHSAGDPILGQIRSKNLTNVLIVVIRYFGGTKLGVGGLIAAYKLAAESALQSATVVEKEVMKRLYFTFPYENTNEVMRLVKEYDLQRVQQYFENECRLQAEVRLAKWRVLAIKIKLLQDLGVPLSVVEDQIPE